eukprot:TRINITY_DN13659_c0_g3_i1.p1 TRINITY_DN13659_c0_g3~~TRINITY_DN13659_c0_g3_i1.p1  ORF type:complete len:283 (-),score=19.33 TRINITY_DN13659_c0_g3_i1:224-991(-)
MSATPVSCRHDVCHQETGGFVELRHVLKMLHHLLEDGEPGLAFELVRTLELNATQAKVTGLGEEVWENISGYIEMKRMAEGMREQSGVDMDGMFDYSRMFNVLTPPTPPSLLELVLSAEGADRCRGVGARLQRVRKLRGAPRGLASPAALSPGEGAPESASRGYTVERSHSRRDNGSSPGCSTSTRKRTCHKVNKGRPMLPSEEFRRADTTERRPPRCAAMVCISDSSNIAGSPHTARSRTRITRPSLACTSPFN